MRPSISTFAGLTSRWIRPIACAASSAEATWRQTSIARYGPQAARRAQHAGEVLALDVLHRQVEQPVDLAGVVDRDDVRVLQGGGDPRLAREALAEARGLGEVGRDDLDGGPAPEVEVLGAVDHAHAAAADPLLDPVAGDHRAEARVIARVRHDALRLWTPSPGCGCCWPVTTAPRSARCAPRSALAGAVAAACTGDPGGRRGRRRRRPARRRCSRSAATPSVAARAGSTRSGWRRGRRWSRSRTSSRGRRVRRRRRRAAARDRRAPRAARAPDRARGRGRGPGRGAPAARRRRRAARHAAPARARRRVPRRQHARAHPARRRAGRPARPRPRPRGPDGVADAPGGAAARPRQDRGPGHRSCSSPAG